jgi:hypothetical protein
MFGDWRCRNRANPTPATKNQKPGLVPGFFVHPNHLSDIRFTSKSAALMLD